MKAQGNALGHLTNLNPRPEWAQHVFVFMGLD